MSIPENVNKILTDLPTLQQVALRPWSQNPLLAVVLSQAQALQEIATWAAQAHELAQQQAEASPVRLVVNDDEEAG